MFFFSFLSSSSNGPSCPRFCLDDLLVMMLNHTLSSTARELQEQLRFHGLEYSDDKEHLQWPANDASHPRNWSTKRKTLDSVIIILLDLATYDYRFQPLRVPS
jgi:hypothetical protein